jgi:PucR family transcriptional regulator, purine catabolism regulatory protein
VLTLGDLLQQKDLGLELVAGDSGCLDRPVEGAHSIELSEPVRWLDENWLMLTTGILLRGRPDEQRRLVGQLDQGGLAALAFGVELVFKRVPRALVEEAERVGFPVLSVPLPTPFRAVEVFVNGAQVSTDLYVLRRSLAMQNYLMDALNEPDPEGALLDRLGTLFGATIALFRFDGQPERDPGPLPVQDIWEEIGARPPAFQQFTVDGRHVTSVPIVVDGVPRRWLVIVSVGRTLPAPLARPVVRAAERLLGMVGLLRRTALAEERALRRDVLEAALGWRAASRPVSQRAAALGLDGRRPLRLALVGVAEEEELEQVEKGLERLLAAAHVPFLLAARGRTLILLAQDDLERLEGWLGALAAEGVEPRAGLAAPFRGIEDAQAALRDAELALEQARRAKPGARRVLSADDVDPITWLAREGARDRVDSRVSTLLEPLREHPALLDTLRAYLDHDLEINRTAAALHLHPNSLRYRLARIERLLGRSLREPATIANLYLATLVEAASGSVLDPG